MTSSDQDAHLFLLQGHGPDGTELRRNDDGGAGRNSKLTSISLAAGDYTISASTYSRQRTGSFQVRMEASAPVVCTQPLGSGTINSAALVLGPQSGTWEPACVLPAGRMGRSGTFYARHYTFTLAHAAQVTVDLTSSDQDAYLFLLQGHGTDGTELRRNDDGGAGRNSKLTSISLAAGDYTISASTYSRQRTGSFQVRMEASAPVVCTQPLGSGTINSAALVLGPQSGTWEPACVLPAGRMGRSGTFYARHYTFTLAHAASVTVDLTSSDQDAYLFLLQGHGPDGTELRRNDNGGDGRNSKLSDISLAAGDYTISASTYWRQRTGDFNVRAEAYFPLTVSRLRRSYSVTVDEFFGVTFGYGPQAAVPSVESVAPSGLSLTIAHLDGWAGFVGRPTHAGTYRVALAFRQGDRVDHYRLVVTVACPEGHTQQSDRTCEAPTEAVCTVPLGNGTVSSGVLELDDPGTWEQSCELPARRRAGDSTYYAKHYSFNLQMDAEVTIDLTSGTDTYLFLLRGHGPEGTEIDHDDNGGVGHNSRLSYRPRLEAGDYTVAASTSSAETTGSFNLAVRAVAHATTTLGSTLDATVGHTQLEEFAFSPAGIAVPTIAPASTPGLDVSVNAANYVELDGKPSLRFTARRADTWALRLVLTQPGRTDTHRFTITATCPRGDTTAPDGTCVAAGARPTVAAGCVTPHRPGWGRIVHSGRWTPGCASTQMPASAARYYRLDVITPGRFAGGNLPIKIELTSDPAASMFMLEGSDPATARLMRFGSSAERTIVSGNTYGLPFGSYIIEVATSQPFDAGASNNFSLAVQLPSGSEQHRDVQLIGNTGLGGDGLSLADFIGYHPDATNIFGADIPYLDWQHDGCGGNQRLEEDTSALPLGRTELLERFESACMRHDFNWSNLTRIERAVDPSVDFWNQTAREESDTRLRDDLIGVCRTALSNTLFQDPPAFIAAMMSCEAKALRITFLVRGLNLGATYG